MRSYGYIKSNLIGNELIADRVIPYVSLPPKYEVSSLSSVRDQGSVPKCVSVALTDMVDWNLTICKIKTKFSDSIFYDKDSTSNSNGMQPKSAFELLVGGRLTEIPYKFSIYAMVTSLEVAKRCIVQYGPIMVCLPVKSMDNMFWKGDMNYGGHAVLFIGYNHNGFILRNSWGYSYGNGGYYEFPYSDFDLIYESWTLLK